jgi:hypothetical protein
MDKSIWALEKPRVAKKESRPNSFSIEYPIYSAPMVFVDKATIEDSYMQASLLFFSWT